MNGAGGNRVCQLHENAVHAGYPKTALLFRRSLTRPQSGARDISLLSLCGRATYSLSSQSFAVYLPMSMLTCMPKRYLLCLSIAALFAVAVPQGSSFAADSEKGRATLFYLHIRGNEVVRARADGSHRRVIVQQQSSGPDGIAVDLAAGHVYWTNMGKASADDGTVMRADLDGGNVTTVVAAGGTFTPKQLKLDAEHRKLYWSDREGMRIMRANVDGSKIETLVITGTGEDDRRDKSKWCVGIALDVSKGKVYWTQKGGDNAGEGTLQ